MRKQPEKKHQNHERWIISYADFTTLLLATFVVMYAISSINSSKFQEMAEAFSTAFMGKITRIQATGLAAAHKAPFDYMPSPVRAPVITRDAQIRNLPPALRQEVAQRAQKLNDAYQKLVKLLGGLIHKGQVSVSLQSLGVVIDINAVVLFHSGKADLTPPALDLIEKVAGILKDLHYAIQVNGFTDNALIHNAQFSSNWDLSAARAMAVVKRFVATGVDPTRLVGAGYGKYHPIASNSTVAGMAKNRRVSIVVVSPVEGKDILRTPLLGGPQNRGGTVPAAESRPSAAASAASPPPAGAPPASMLVH
ncbi:MAG: flagellar motor protein MotB [Stellaceae bacterium]